MRRPRAWSARHAPSMAHEIPRHIIRRYVIRPAHLHECLLRCAWGVHHRFVECCATRWRIRSATSVQGFNASDEQVSATSVQGFNASDEQVSATAVQELHVDGGAKDCTPIANIAVLLKKIQRWHRTHGVKALALRCSPALTGSPRAR
jgi:hypothetical protein